MNTDRMQELITMTYALEAMGVEPRRGREPIDNQKFLEMETFGYVNECGTSACLAGWATYHGPFIAQGLTRFTDPHVGKDDYNFYPAFDTILGFDAVMEFFDLTSEEAEVIFAANHSNYFDHARERIQFVIDGNINEDFIDTVLSRQWEEAKEREAQYE